MTGPRGSSAGSEPILPGPRFPPMRETGQTLTPSEQTTRLKTCHLSTSHQPQCCREWYLLLNAANPPRQGQYLQRRHPRVLPPCPLCGWGLTAAPHVGGSASTRNSSDVLRLLSPHKGWKLPLFSPWSPVPNQYGSPGWTTEGLEATWRGNVEDRMPAWTPGYSYQTHQERPPP